MANEIFKAPAGFLVVLARGAQVLPGGLAVQFKLRSGQAAGRLSITEMTLDPIAWCRRTSTPTRTSTRTWPRARLASMSQTGVRSGPGMLSAQTSCCRSRVLEPQRQAGENS